MHKPHSAIFFAITRPFRLSCSKRVNLSLSYFPAVHPFAKSLSFLSVKMVQEFDSHFGEYGVLQHLPRKDQALQIIKKAASMVKPIMRKRGWRVGVLEEFLPDEANLLGLNINRTQRILIRLRYHNDPSLFRPWEDIMDTLLHELCHIVWGPHDHKFHGLWNELRDEHMSLVRKGYSGEGFLTKGQKLGGARVPVDELRRRARAAAEARSKLSKTREPSHGNRVGGKPVLRGTDMRKVIADAADRRSNITQGCASGSKEADRLAEQARRNGFRSKAEEDDANNLAIANALIELMEDEEERKIQGWNHPADEGLQWTPENGLDFAQGPSSSSRKPTQASSSKPASSSSRAASTRSAPPVPQQSKPAPAPSNSKSSAWTRSTRPNSNRPAAASRLLAEDSARQRPKSTSSSQTASASREPPPLIDLTSPIRAVTSATATKPTWSCAVCTLENPLELFNCEACNSEMPVLSPLAERFERGGSATGSAAAKQAQQRLGWNCRACGSFMESKWWTCSACGLMKAQS